MSNDRSLNPLLALLAQAEKERDDALANVQRASAAHQAAQGQADQLVNYRGEYESRFQNQFSAGGSSIAILQCYQGFGNRLGDAITQQNHVANRAELQVEKARAFLREQEMRVASVRKLIERRVQELRLASDRREQKQSDEFAARAAWSRLQMQSHGA